MQKFIIFRDTNASPRRQRESPTRLDSDRSKSALSQGFSQLKSSRILLHQSPERRDGANKFSSESFKTLSSFVNENFKNKEQERNEKSSKRLSFFNGSTENGLTLDGIKSIL